MTFLCLIFFIRYGKILNPYSKAVPAVIAKGSTIYNPFIYAIIHSKYRLEVLYKNKELRITVALQDDIFTGTLWQKRYPVCTSWPKPSAEMV